MTPSFSGDRLRGHRHGLGRELADVASNTGCTTEALEAFEAGRAEPSPEHLAALAVALGVPVEELYAQHAHPRDDYMHAVVHRAEPLSDAALRAIALVTRA